MKNILVIALGGSLGALSRYYLSKMITDYSGGTFPWGTLMVNLIGALLIGFLYGLFDRIIIPIEFRVFITIGFIGAFTTFSTFALESVNLLRDGEIKLGLSNIIINNGASIICVLLGFYIAGLIMRK
ncbi:MAG: fluoride efflux transporter CrcB [candidate division WOR-3 bacterium]|jgi:fluoride exporter